MQNDLLLILSLLFGVLILIMQGQKLRISYAKLSDAFPNDISENELIAILKTTLKGDIEEKNQRLNSLECDTMAQEEIDRYHHVLQHLYTHQRKELFQMRKENAFSDEIIQKQLQIDLDEAKINNHTH